MTDAAMAISGWPALPLVCALLRGELPPWPSAPDGSRIANFLSTARAHGVTPLLDRNFAASAVAGSWPDAVRCACHDDALTLAMQELVHRGELVRVLAALAAAGVAPLIMKGTGLAHSHYPNPALRPRADTDLLVAPSARTAALDALRAHGYSSIAGPAGLHVGYQCTLRYEDPRRSGHEVDLHWRLSNAQSFAWLFTFEQLAAASVPVPALGPTARRLGDAHALILALLHRAGNNRFVEPGFGDRLIWLYDMLLLVDAMSDDERSRFLQLADDAGIVAIAIDGLRCCADAFRSPRVEALVTELQRSSRANSGAAFLHSGKFALKWLELRAIPTNSARLGYLAGRLFPRAEYMRERYPDAADRTLPMLHARRWAEGVARRWSAHRR